MRQIQKMKQAIKDMRQQLDEGKRRNNAFKPSRLTVPELKTLAALLQKMREGDGLSVLDDGELDELERLCKKAENPNMPDVVDCHYDENGEICEACKHLYNSEAEEEAPHDF